MSASPFFVSAEHEKRRGPGDSQVLSRVGVELRLMHGRRRANKYNEEKKSQTLQPTQQLEPSSNFLNRAVRETENTSEETI